MGTLDSSISVTITLVDFSNPPGVLSLIIMHSAFSRVAFLMPSAINSAVTGFMAPSIVRVNTFWAESATLKRPQQITMSHFFKTEYGFIKTIWLIGTKVTAIPVKKQYSFLIAVDSFKIYEDGYID
jgi:hypothetical protein